MMRNTLTVRLSILAVILTSLFVALFARLIFLQVLDSPQLAAEARANQIRTVYEDAPRGRILDRNGNVLAGDKETDDIVVDRNAAQVDANLLPKLATFLNVTVASLQQKMNNSTASPYRPVPVATNVDKAVIASFKERQSEFQGAEAETEVQRWYPNGTLAAHILGYTGEINQTELSSHKGQNYRLGDQIGKSGIESAYESALRGKPGVDKVEVNSSGEPVRVISHTPPTPGKDVVLSIDVNVQRTAEQALSAGLATARTQLKAGSGSPASAGSVVAIDPRDGSVLAMASYPTYDPNTFAGGISAAQYAQLTNPADGLPLDNRAIQGEYAPGSTFKLVTSTAALSTGLITPQTTIVDNGSFVLGPQHFQNAEGERFGPLNLQSALTVSSDVFFYNVGDRFWNERKTLGEPIQNTAKAFGFGATEGIGLPGEEPGRIADPASRKKMHEENPSAFPNGDWYAGDNVNLAIGQGDTLVTPLQLANAYATFANGGTLYQPRMVEKVVDANGKVISNSSPHILNRVSLPPGISQPIQAGLVGAVTNSRGTAYTAFQGFDTSAFPVAAKTGTAQVDGKQDSALFATYGPVGNARIAVSVVLEQSGFGGTAAAPVARQVLAQVSGQSIQPIKLGSADD
jgi:penicillin-binding protein 2